MNNVREQVKEVVREEVRSVVKESLDKELGPVKLSIDGVTKSVDELKGEHRTFRDSTTAQYAGLIARVDRLEQEKTAMREQYQRVIDLYLQSLGKWQEQVKVKHK